MVSPCAHRLAAVSHGLPEGLDTVIAALDAAGVDHGEGLSLARPS